MSIFKRGKHAKAEIPGSSYGSGAIPVSEEREPVELSAASIQRIAEGVRPRVTFTHEDVQKWPEYKEWRDSLKEPVEFSEEIGPLTLEPNYNPDEAPDTERTPEELERTGGFAFKAWADDNWVKTEWNEDIGRFVRVEPDYNPGDFPLEGLSETGKEWAEFKGYTSTEDGEKPEESAMRDEYGNVYRHWSEDGESVISPFEAELDLVLGEIRALLLEKNASYGDSALNPVRIMSDADAIEQLKVRIDDKFSRMYRGFAYEDTETGSPEDTLKDIVGYYFLLKIAEARNAQS